MYFRYDEADGITKVFLEIEDICFTCENMNDCPLAQAIESHLVYPATSYIQIAQCPLYEPLNVTETS